MWPCEARYRALASLGEYMFVLSTNTGDSITIPSTTTIGMVDNEQEMTYADLAATLTEPGTTGLFRTSSHAEYRVSVDGFCSRRERNISTEAFQQFPII